MPSIRISVLFLLFSTVLAASCAKDKPSGSPTANALAHLSPSNLSPIRTSLLGGYGIRMAADPGSELNCRDVKAQLPGFRSGVVEVPEDWAQPEHSPKIKVFYYWRPAPRGKENRAPVVFLNGGPAQPGFSSAIALSPLEFAGKQAIVFFDQRGTGCSTRYPVERDEATIARLANWGSESIVRDAEAIRKKLFGAKQWRVFGQSYGGLIAHRYMELAPEGVDRLIVHGYAFMQDPKAWFAERILSQKRIADHYFAQHPGDRALLAQARAAIAAGRCWERANAKICGPGIVDSLSLLLGFKTNWGRLHGTISALMANGKLKERELNKVIEQLIFAFLIHPDSGGSVISATEITPGVVGVGSCPEVEQMLRARGERPEAYDFNECRLGAAFAPDKTDELIAKLPPRPLSLEKIKANLKQHRIPFFLFSGEEDTFAPKATFSEEVLFLGELVRYRELPGSGHDGFITEPEVLDAVAD